MVTSAGAKLVDFGLAKARTSSVVDAGELNVLRGAKVSRIRAPFSGPIRTCRPSSCADSLSTSGRTSSRRHRPLTRWSPGCVHSPEARRTQSSTAILSASSRFRREPGAGTTQSPHLETARDRPREQVRQRRRGSRELQVLNTALAPTRSSRRSRTRGSPPALPCARGRHGRLGLVAGVRQAVGARDGDARGHTSPRNGRIRAVRRRSPAGLAPSSRMTRRSTGSGHARREKPRFPAILLMPTSRFGPIVEIRGCGQPSAKPR